MNMSPFMDKQVMDLSNSQNKNTTNTDFMDLNIHPSQDDHNHNVGDGDDKKDEILPNYDFQPIRPITSSQLSNFDSGNVGGTRVWSSAEFEPNFGTRNYRSLDSVEPSKVAVEKDRTVLDAALISEIDRTMKKHADNLMHALESVRARLSQLETRSRNLENSVDDLRTSVGNNHGNTDGKLRQIENIIREVQAGVLVVKDKQEILEAQLKLSQVQISKPEQQPGPQIVGHMESLQHHAAPASASAPLHSHQQLPPAAIPQQHAATLPNAPPPPNPQPNKFQQNIMPMPVSHRDSYYPPPGQTAEAPPPPPPLPQQYQLPPTQQLQPPMASPSSPRPQYQPPTQIQYSQPPPMSLQQPNPSQIQPPSSHPSEELAYLSSQSYQASGRQPGGGPPAQQFHGNPSQMYKPPPSGRTGPGYSSQYGPSPGFSESYGFGGSQYGSGSPVKSQHEGYDNGNGDQFCDDNEFQGNNDGEWIEGEDKEVNNYYDGYDLYNDDGYATNAQPFNNQRGDRHNNYNYKWIPNRGGGNDRQPHQQQRPSRPNQRAPVHGVNSYFQPAILVNMSPIIPLRRGRAFDIRPGYLNALPHFIGNETEEPYIHLADFEAICDIIGGHNFSTDEVKMRLFQFTLKEKAKKWFLMLPANSIRTWAEMQQAFLDEYYSVAKTSDARKDIRYFKQQPGELFHEAFLRFKELLHMCPHHRIEKWELIKSFFDGLTQEERKYLYSTSNGTFLANNEDDDWDFLERMSKCSKVQASEDRRSRLASPISTLRDASDNRIASLE